MACEGAISYAPWLKGHLKRGLFALKTPFSNASVHGIASIMKTIIAVTLGLLLSTPLLACQFDTDCFPGSTCVKSGWSLYGICAGGLNPGNNNDNQPVYNQLNPWKKTGNTCQFDIDCGIGSECLKSGYSIYGVCN